MAEIRKDPNVLIHADAILGAIKQSISVFGQPQSTSTPTNVSGINSLLNQTIPLPQTPSALDNRSNPFNHNIVLVRSCFIPLFINTISPSSTIGECSTRHQAASVTSGPIPAIKLWRTACPRSSGWKATRLCFCRWAAWSQSCW